jgi:hypothetical protein
VQTTRLCTFGSFSTTIMCSPCWPPNPSSAIAPVASWRRRSRYAESIHARATGAVSRPRLVLVGVYESG